MKFSINKKDFVHYVQHLTQIVPQKSTMQIAGCILLDAYSEKNQIRLVTTDLNITAIATIEANVLESGSICIPSKKFSDIIQALPDAMIQFNCINDKLDVTCEKSNYTLNIIDSSLFPIIPEYNSESRIVFDKNVFAKMVANTSFATGVDSTNPMFSGVYCNFSATEQIMAATDSKRIAEVKTFAEVNLAEPMEFVIPVKTLTFIEKFFTNDVDDITLIDEGTKVVLVYNNIVVITNKYAGKYPIYSVVFKKEHENSLIVDKVLMKDATRRVSLLNAEDDRNIIKVSVLQNEIAIEAINNELGAGKETIDNFSFDGEPLVIGLNSRFLLSFLNVIDSDEVLFKIGKSTDAIWILNNDDDDSMSIRFVVMPLRLE
ncbi:MAG TPA: DNA polymerase III subunit beta [Candidatus Cloacimonadota bacterium]|nr:DNA polymerase III subunit beta [Candidatus Cloacimonadota bacterium]HPK40773.1 DNA polymerase III subunit beta [Candidatus Cloacimonadota bacterium]